jgi:hypothetical protein
MHGRRDDLIANGDFAIPDGHIESIEPTGLAAQIPIRDSR